MEPGQLAVAFPDPDLETLTNVGRSRGCCTLSMFSSAAGSACPVPLQAPDNRPKATTALNELICMTPSLEQRVCCCPDTSARCTGQVGLPTREAPSQSETVNSTTGHKTRRASGAAVVGLTLRRACARRATRAAKLFGALGSKFGVVAHEPRGSLHDAAGKRGLWVDIGRTDTGSASDSGWVRMGTQRVTRCT